MHRPVAAAVCIYLLLAVEFLLRYAYDRPVRRSNAARPPVSRGIKLMVLGLGIDGLFILIRSIYRVIVSAQSRLANLFAHFFLSLQELNDGWSGRIISTQVYFSRAFHLYHPSHSRDRSLIAHTQMCSTARRSSAPCTLSTSCTPACFSERHTNGWTANL